MNESKTDLARTPKEGSSLGRRDLMKLGAGVLVTAMNAPKAEAQNAAAAPTDSPQAGKTPAPGSWTHAGWVNDANRPKGQGPLDDSTRKIVKYVTEFSDTKLTPTIIAALNNIVVDSMAALVTGFESEPVRICARMARLMPAGEMKSTLLGYGLTATPELAAFGNGNMMRHTDFNDLGSGHPSEVIPGILAIAEPMHSSGTEVLTAIVLGYELQRAGAGGVGGATAMCVGKLMKLNEDQLANALAYAVTRTGPSRGNGPLNMTKSSGSAEANKTGIWGALLAREGFTTNARPFEGRRGTVQLPLNPQDRWRSQDGKYHVPPSPGFEDGPDAGEPVVWTGFKKYPAEGSTQSTIELIPRIREWTSVDEIEWIHHELPRGNWGEIADPAKWDPRNRETADHSLPYLIARGLIDGEIYISSFTEAKITDSAVRVLMAKISITGVEGWSGNAPARITIHKKNGEERSWDAHEGQRVNAMGEHLDKIGYRLSHEEIIAKFNRACAYMHVPDGQRDEARGMWGNLRAVKDIGDAMRTLAKFGGAKPL